MAKRKFLSVTELENILASTESDEESEDYSSDDSVKDPIYDPTPNSSENDEDEEVPDTIDQILENLALEENREERDEEEEEDVVGSETEIINAVWSEYESRHKTFTFSGKSGLQVDVPQSITPFEAFRLFIDDEVINVIVLETNRYAEQQLAAKGLKRESRMKKWTPTNSDEMKKFLGLLIWMGLVRLGSIPSYWSTSDIYRNNVAPKIMSRNRFEVMLANIHFANNETIPKGDRIGKVQPLIDILEKKYKEILYPGEDFVIDETLVPWRGRLIFRQYIPNKAHKYGIKLFKLCSTEGYTWASKIYSGKSEVYSKKVGLGRSICEELLRDLLNQGRTLFVDNFYPSYELGLSFLRQNTHVVGTLRANKKHMPKEVFDAKLEKGQVIYREDQNGIVVLKWRDTRDVRILSTKHSPQMVEENQNNVEQALIDVPDQPSTSNASSSKRRLAKKNKKKPIAILAYNKGKAGIDLSDQNCSYATTLRKGVKWYRKLGIEYLLGISVVNAFAVYKKATKKRAQKYDGSENKLHHLF